MRPEEVETFAGAHKPLNFPLHSDEKPCPWAATVLLKLRLTPGDTVWEGRARNPEGFSKAFIFLVKKFFLKITFLLYKKVVI